MDNQKRYSVSTIVITVIAIIIILVLAFFIYFYSARIASFANGVLASITNTNSITIEKKPVAPTNVINFASPEILPAGAENGECFSESIAAYRKDAWRCMVQNNIYDPCFEIGQEDLVFCQINPLISDFVLIKLTKPLPSPSAFANTQDNWAWFLTLEDGTYCSPFTGTRPFFSQNQVAYYGCHSGNKDQQVVLLGDLTKNTVWIASKAILEKNGAAPSGSWTIKLTQKVDIKTVWQ